jgi:hypothetical protein
MDRFSKKLFSYLFKRQERRDYLVPILTQLMISTSDLETNKFVLTSLLFKIWQQHQCHAGVFMNFKSTIRLYIWILIFILVFLIRSIGL